MLRLILAFIAGFIITAGLSTGTDFALQAVGIAGPIFDNKLLMVATVYRFIYEVGGVYGGCLIAKDRAKTLAWISGILGTILWLVGGIAQKDISPLWYPITGAILSVPSALLGLRLAKG